MAIRTIRLKDDEILRKKSREVKKIDEKILTLLDDMADTMYDANGVGLAAPQVGMLKRVVVIDVGDGLIELINPVVVETRGERLFHFSLSLFISLFLCSSCTIAHIISTVKR